MTAAIILKTEGARAIERQLAVLDERVGDIEPLLGDMGLYLESATIDRFDTETAPDGSKWTPSIRAKEEGGKTLTDSSQLRSSITHNVTSNSVEVGTNKIYAGVHNDGATIRAKSAGKLAFFLPGGLGFRKVDQVTSPQRQFLGIGSENEVELLALADDYLAFAEGGAA